MKKIISIVCLMLMSVAVLAPAAFATTQTGSTDTFNLKSSIPKSGAENVSVENLSVKIYFDTDMVPATKSAREANEKNFKLTDPKGKKIPIKVYYSHKEEGLVMVVSDIVKKDIKIASNVNYKLSISENLKSAEGASLGKTETIKFKTLDQAGSTKVYMIMMAVMIVGMIYFTSRSTKKAMEKEKAASGKEDTVNPYKEAKKTGKSVKEIVEMEEAKKAKRKAAQEKAASKNSKASTKKETKDDKKDSIHITKRVQGPKPISEIGSTYKVTVKKSKPTPVKSTNPKNQTGKQKNSKNKNSKGGKKK